jgi:DinB superfamily
MTEIPWFERNLVFGKPKELLPYFLERLEGTIVRVEAKVQMASDIQLSKQIGGKWSVKQNIGHLAEVDEIANKRIDEMKNGIPVLSPAVFEPRLDYNSMPVAKVIEFFREKRLANIAKYETLAPVDMTKASLHPRLKVQMTPVDLAWFDAEHDDHHLVRINQILQLLHSGK